MLEKKTNRAGLIISLLTTTVLLLTGMWAFMNRQYIFDQLRVWDYTPSTEVSTLNDQLLLTDEGTFRLYVTHPTVEDAETFNLLCPKQEENNPILGCYTGDRIYIYDVENESLEGIKQVTAAHEMLHSAWDRLSTNEKDEVSDLLQSEFESIADEVFLERMQYYERNEPGQFHNELHSIIGTELSSISEELEAYYSRYFDDRQVIVAYNQQYSKVFNDLSSQADEMAAALQTLGNEINNDRLVYEQQLTLLGAEIDSFNQRAENGDFSSQSEFNAERSNLLARSAELEASRAALNQKIDRYNQLYASYQEIASEISQLNDSIDSEATVPELPSV
jgi:hypothetical protein